MDPKSQREQSEAEWEREVLEDALGDALNEDGTTDYDRLHEMTEPFDVPTPEAEADESNT